MRIILAIIVWVVFIGSLTFYMMQRDNPVYSPDDIMEFKRTQKAYILEITPSFVLASDPFALNLNHLHSPSPLLMVRSGNHDILKITESSDAPEYFRTEPLALFNYGKNEIYVEASPPLDHHNVHHALRIRVMENDYTLAEKTLWSPPGTKVSGTFAFILKENESKPVQETYDDP